MTAAWEVIDSQTLGSAAASVTFSSIPQGYRDLVLVFGGSTASDDYLGLQFNSDTTSSYSVVRAYNTLSGTFNTTYGLISSGDVSIDNLQIVQIMDYSATDKHKTFLSRSNNSGYVAMHAGRWANTSAITLVKIMTGLGANYVAGSTFTLYGSNRA